jgi:very-short-patch-repair endonuclease
MNARQLRNAATPAERALWRILSPYRPRFTRQLVVGPYIVDIACRSAKLGIELDGGQHLENQQYDRSRTAYLESLGWHVLRFWNSEVGENPDGVAETILAAVRERLETHPQPLPVSREGGRKV